MRLKSFSKLLGLAALMALSSAMAANKPSPTSAEFYKLNPEKYADKEITLEVSFLRAFDRKSPVPQLKFLHAATYDTKNGIPGGIITVVIPAGDLEKLLKKYGSFPEGGRPWNWKSEKMRGIFRIGPRGHFYLDVSGDAAALLNGRDFPDDPEPVIPRGPGAGNGSGPGVPEPTQS